MFLPATFISFLGCTYTTRTTHSPPASGLRPKTYPLLRLSDQLFDQAEILKSELVQLAQETQRGFQASASQRKQARDLISQLEPLSPTEDPLQSYYPTTNENAVTTATKTTLRGSWTLVYTDAPDITSLRPPSSLLGELGRIGQRCDPPFISNVIEWKRPSWADAIPFTRSRLLQIVVTEAETNPTQRDSLKLKLSGVQVEIDSEEAGTQQLLDLNGPLTVPFGEFRILYLDDEFRVTQTGQDFVAVNTRVIGKEQEWF